MACYFSFKMVTQAPASLHSRTKGRKKRSTQSPGFRRFWKIPYNTCTDILLAKTMTTSSCNGKCWLLTGFVTAPNKIRDPLLERKRKMDIKFVPTQEALLQQFSELVLFWPMVIDCYAKELDRIQWALSLNRSLQYVKVHALHWES